MKQTKTTRKIPKKSTKIKSVKVSITKAPLLKHLRLVEHKHTGKILGHRHTSHASLVLILALLGFFLYISDRAVTAAQTVSSSVNVGLVVPGPPPTEGATITSPKTDGTVSSPFLTLGGTCASETLVADYIDENLAGSTICTTAGIFKLDVQLHKGKNTLTAMNFDNLNQPGPASNSIDITYITNDPVKLDMAEPITPNLPKSPLLVPGIPNEVATCSSYDYAVQTGGNGESSVIAVCTNTQTVNTCSDYRLTKELPVGGDPHITVVCTEKYVNAKEKMKLGILAWGGNPPYALSVDWNNDGKNTLISIPKPAYANIETSYAVLGAYDVKVLLTDTEGKVANTETTVQVNGTEVPQSIIEFFKSNISKSWFETPVPIYVVVVAITLGFWGGDIFYRKTIATKNPVSKIAKQKS
jgi:hypothetical protein